MKVYNKTDLRHFHFMVFSELLPQNRAVKDICPRRKNNLRIVTVSNDSRIHILGDNKMKYFSITPLDLL